MDYNKNRGTRQPSHPGSQRETTGNPPVHETNAAGAQKENAPQDTSSVSHEDKRRRRGNAGGDKRHGGNR